MHDSDWVIAICTLLSPLIAVQISGLLDRRREHKNQKIRIFGTLMSTRGTILDPRHVESLNLIDLVFYSRSKQETEIRRRWKEYLDHLNDTNYPKDGWPAKRLELLVELLYAIAVHLGYDMDKTHIKHQCYYPSGLGTIQEEQAQLRRAALDLLAGKAALPVKFESQISAANQAGFPPPPAPEAVPLATSQTVVVGRSRG